MIATAAAIAFFGERPGALALFGVLLIAGGVFSLTWSPGGAGAARWGWGAAYGLLTGMFIAGYTLWDKQAVAVVAITPLLLDWSANTVRALLLTPLGIRRRKRVREIWRSHKLEVTGVAILSPLSYILVLSALVFTPVSYVAPTREISILIGVIMGASLLSEGDTKRRIFAASAMVLGVAALALG